MENLTHKRKVIQKQLVLWCCSPVRFLEPSTSTTTTKLLGLTPSGISNKQSPIIPHKNILNLLLLLFIHKLLVIRHECFRNALTNGIYLRSVTSAFHTNPHIDGSKLRTADQKDRFERLCSKNLRL
ncbi:hypothetical protein HanIR_Chr09g0406941 [Helianthus annuus]|nr:hypothetical protein HanIR_Chr09g0406941 [Helianthus annuus]